MAPCTVRWCGKTSQSSSLTKDGITFHLYPKDPGLKERWIEATRRENWFPSSSSVVCSRHFKADCFVAMKSRRRLYSSAVPSLYLPILTEPTDSESDGLTPSTQIVPSTSTDTPKRKSPVNKIESPSLYNSPTKKRLCRKVIELTDKVVQKNKQLKNLRQYTYTLRKKLAGLKTILNDLEQKNLINPDNMDLLNKIGVTNKELLQRQILKSNKGCIIRKKYSAELRTFALTLNFYSTKAYNYVRKTFQTCLPSLKTISKWYQSVDGKPGFTKEAFIVLKHKASQCDELICTLIFDEMKIKNKVEYVPATQRTFGYVDFGGEIQTDSNDECTEALVLLVVGLNKRFKVPIGYFLTNGTKSHQKVNLVLQALHLCHENNITIKALTFDGCPANISMAKQLGCVFNTTNTKTSFKHPITKHNIFVFLDPVHMLKLVRNAFEHYTILYDSEGRKIEWNYLKMLQELQDREQFHLANKLRLSHIMFKQNIMKVKLATQLFSRSVATALKFCKTELKLLAFQNVDATVDFLLVVNDLFDVLDSKVHGYGYKRALNNKNVNTAFVRLEQCQKFLLTMTIMIKQNTHKELIYSPRSTGFIGFHIAIESVKGMYRDLIERENSFIKYLPFHKVSQDHIELFFATMRSYGGCNDNPTPRLFESIYKKILIHVELVDVSTGNCVPLENISILNCSSAIRRINLTSIHGEKKEITIDNETEEDVNTAIESICLSQFAESAIHYIAGFVVSSLIKKLKCRTCIRGLVCLNEDKNSFIGYRDKGGLLYPSKTVIKICRRSELILKCQLANIKKGQWRKVDILVNKTLNSFVGEELFSDIKDHQFHSEETNHVVDLSICVMQKYLNTRLAFLTKSTEHKPTIRRMYTKLIHFKND